MDVIYNNESYTVAFLDIRKFLMDHGALAVKVDSAASPFFLVYDEENSLVWVDASELTRVGAEIHPFPTNGKGPN